MSSKIKVDTIENVAGSGNVSLGSGHNLVVPGNITGQGTTTLTGDLAVDTDTLFADVSADKVGINNSSPNHELQINGNSTTSSLSLKTSATGNATSDGLELKVQGDSAAYLYNYENAMLRFGTNGLERVRIDASGRVTLPSQPYFAAHMTGNGAYSTRSANHVFDFNTAVYNVGSHFNTTNHRFTAPVDGKYLFTVSFITNDSTPTGRIAFYVNGSASVSSLKFGINGSNTGGGGGTNASSIIQLSASDYVDVRSQAGSTQFYEDSHSSFTGILLA